MKWLRSKLDNLKKIFLGKPLEEQEPLQWDISEPNESSATLDEVKFIFYQVEKALERCLNTGNRVVERSTTMLSVSVGFLLVLLGHIATKLQGYIWIDELFEPLTITAVLVSVYLIPLIFIILKNLEGHKYYSIGSDPKLLLRDSLFEKYKDPEDQGRRLVKIYISEIRDYQDRLEAGESINNKRWLTYHLALNWFKILPFYSISIFLILRIIFK